MRYVDAKHQSFYRELLRHAEAPDRDVEEHPDFSHDEASDDE